MNKRIKRIKRIKLIKRDEGGVNNKFVKMLEALGYDIELHYVKRRKSKNRIGGIVASKLNENYDLRWHSKCWHNFLNLQD